MTSPALDADGRRARRDANRLAVLDAVLALFAEGETNPTPDQVAERAGLSPRSVYRYVASREELQRAAIERQVDHLIPLLELANIGQGPVSTRIRVLVAQRLALYRAIERTNPLAKALSLKNELVATKLREAALVMREQTANQFAPELSVLSPSARRLTLDALDALTQPETFHHYLTVLGRSDEATVQSLTHIMHATLERKSQ